MTKPKTNAEYVDAAIALINWFKSQDLGPGDAGIVMAKVIATTLVSRNQDLASIAKGIKLITNLATLEAANLVRA